MNDLSLLWDDLKSMISTKTKQLSQSIDLSGIDLPEVKTKVGLDDSTMTIIKVVIGLFVLWCIAKILKLIR